MIHDIMLLKFCFLFSKKKNYLDEATLREHIQLMSGISSGDRLLHIIKRPWFIATAGVLIWITFIALITFIWWRWRKSKGKAAGLLFLLNSLPCVFCY